jgi:hypothetical protein
MEAVFENKKNELDPALLFRPQLTQLENFVPYISSMSMMVIGHSLLY